MVPSPISCVHTFGLGGVPAVSSNSSLQTITHSSAGVSAVVAA